jgi:arginase
MKGKSIKFISVAYDSAHFNERMGAGPSHIINKGFIPKFKSPNIKIGYKEILLTEVFPTEPASTFRLLALLKTEIIQAVEEQSFPIVLSGNCCATVAVIAGLNSSDVGVVWFDAHGDCETPETTSSGFFDGMGLSLLTNQCWKNLLSIHKLNTSLTGKHVCLIGARDLSEYEKDFISANGIKHVTVEEVKEPNYPSVKVACLKLRQSGVKRFHLHFDVDVVDPLTATANSYAVSNGLNKDDVTKIINYIISEFRVSSLTIASYDPSFDNNDKMLDIIQELVELVIKQI